MSTIAVLVCLSSLAIVTFAQCPQGWQQSSLGNQKCYLVVTDVKMFDDAETFCTRATQNGHLSSIASKFENDFISDMVRRAGVSTNYWMGANNYGQPMSSKIFNWIDRKPWNYDHWAPGQPDGSGANCAASAGSGLWSVRDCEQTYAFICEMFTNGGK